MLMQYFIMTSNTQCSLIVYITKMQGVFCHGQQYACSVLSWSEIPMQCFAIIIMSVKSSQELVLTCSYVPTLNKSYPILSYRKYQWRVCCCQHYECSVFSLSAILSVLSWSALPTQCLSSSKYQCRASFVMVSNTHAIFCHHKKKTMKILSS